MNYADRNVGGVALSADAPPWLVQLAAAVEGVERLHFLSQMQAFMRKVEDAGKAQALEQARALVGQYQLKAEDVFADKRKKVVAKYRDPATGQTWSGRGRVPKWLVGKDLPEFSAHA